MSAQAHLPVLLEEVLSALAPKPNGRYVDCTFGRGGHARAILARLDADGRLYAIDRDIDAVRAAQTQFAHDPRFAIVNGRFSMLQQLVENWGIAARVDGILLDLGVSSPQLDDAARGFSFRREGPLDMRMGNEGMSAAEWIDSAEAGEIAEVLYRLGEERFGRRIANAIVRARAITPIETTSALAKIVADAVPTREPGKDPATRSFQAIRMHINQELPELESVLPQTLNALAPGGRLAVISFHSLEDRAVKQFIRKHARGDDFPANLPVTHDKLRPLLKPIGKAIRASAAEVATNPRARSAVLRVAERLAA